MLRFALTRALWGLAAVWLAASLAFVLVHAAPGGPAAALLGEHAAVGQVEDIHRRLGLDQPMGTQYLQWLARLLLGDLGHSYRAQQPVAQLIAERAPVTLALMLPALALSTLAGLALALATAQQRHPSGHARWLDGALAGLHALPGYVVAQGLVMVFALGLGWFPVQGLGSRQADGTLLPGWAETIWRLALPVLALALLQLAFVALLARARLDEELGRPYVTAALARGLPEARVRWRHALPNAALPLLVLIGWRFGAIVGGSVVIETVFALPGLGRLVITSALARDFPVVVGIVLVACTAVVAVNVIVDLLAWRLDPRLWAQHGLDGRDGRDGKEGLSAAAPTRAAVAMAGAASSLSAAAAAPGAGRAPARP